ncbi:MAG: hypothetical protein K2F84_01605 [Bacteroidales bacterium]|nr:hypothetical protein [Bacteroidales bacterium]
MPEYSETENFRPETEPEAAEPEVFLRKTVEENIYNSRGCAHAPSLQDTPCDRSRQMSCCAQMHAYNWTDTFGNLPSPDPFDLVEVRFKNTHKDFFRLPGDTTETYECGDIVAVEGNSGHDIGIICLRGELARMQAKNKGIDPLSPQIKKVYRKARPNDIDKWLETIRIEKETQRRARVIAAELGLDMKINNVEYQGDFTKAIFYYTADDRVDFRQLIKLYAEEFKVRIEMKQIGARQEAGNIGGIGSCGRELCCVTFLHNFTSVSTHAARVQQVSLNPQKLAGQCSKLKCCLNYEYDTYIDLQKSMPDARTPIVTEKGKAKCIKTDILNHKMTYVYEDEPNRYINVDAEEAARLIEANRRGETPADLTASRTEAEIVPEETAFSNVVGQDDLTRFDKPNKGNRSNKKKRHGHNNGGERNEKAAAQGKPAPAQNKQAETNVPKPAPAQSKPAPAPNKPKQEKRAPKPIGKPILKPKTPGDANAQ